MSQFLKIIQNNSIHIFAIILFAIITIIYCAPFLRGDKINQSDYKQFLGMSKEIVDYRAENDQEALWTNSMFSGMPAYQISVHYPNNILVHIDKMLQLYLPRPVGIIFLYFLGFYILLLYFKVNPHISILGALAFGLSSYFFIILEAGHNTKAHAIAYIAPSVLAMLYCFQNDNKSIWINLNKLFFLFLFLGLHLRANHLQITYYLLFILTFFIIHFFFQSIQKKQFLEFIKSSCIFVIGGVLATAINLGNIWSTYEYSEHTTRGVSELVDASGNMKKGLDKDYATSWSYGKMESFNMLFPNFVGGSSHAKLSEKSYLYQALRDNGISKRDSQQFIKNTPLYFGPQSFTSGPVYVGSIIWLLFFIGLFAVKKPIKWVLVALALTSLILSWGKYFPLLTNVLFEYFPLYNKFRTVSMILIILEFTVPLLAIMGLHQFIKLDISHNDKKKIIINSASVLIITSLFFLLFKNLIFDFTSLNDLQFPAWFTDALILDRKSLFQGDILRSLFFILSASFLIYYIVHTDRERKTTWIYILMALVLIDMLAVNKRYLNADDFVPKGNVETPFQLELVDKIIKQDTSVYRVYNLNERLDQGARTSYFHHSVAGYHGAKLGKYQEVMDMHISKGNINVLNMLNVKYLIVPNENGELVVQSNSMALGNAWFVDTIDFVNSANKEIEALTDFNPKNTAVLHEKNKHYLENFSFEASKSNIDLIKYEPNKLIYNTNMKSTSLAVFSEIFYPEGWNAYIDGVLTPHFSVNYILRGLIIPASAQEIIFEFRPKSFFISAKISFVLSILLIIMALSTVLKLYYNKE